MTLTCSCRGLFTQYKREEDATMQSGKLDEELSRMSSIVDALTSSLRNATADGPNSLLLFNESFAATNEREGSEIARLARCVEWCGRRAGGGSRRRSSSDASCHLSCGG